MGKACIEESRGSYAPLSLLLSSSPGAFLRRWMRRKLETEKKANSSADVNSALKTALKAAQSTAASEHLSFDHAVVALYEYEYKHGQRGGGREAALKRTEKRWREKPPITLLRTLSTSARVLATPFWGTLMPCLDMISMPAYSCTFSPRDC